MKTFSSWQMSGITLGGILILWAFAIVFTKSTVGNTLDFYGMRGIFFGMMIVAGSLSVIGSFLKCRKLRMWGLAMTPFIMFPCAFTMFIEGVINTATITMPWIGLMSILILLRDSTRKSRYEPMAR